MEKRPRYKCDPSKHTKCPKHSCKYNKDAIDPVCDATYHIEYSVDGKEITEAEDEL